MSIKLTTFDRDNIINRYTAGEPANKLASEFNISVIWVRTLIQRAKAQRPQKPLRKLTDTQAQEVGRLYQSGKTTTELGSMFGVSNRTISEYLKRLGVKSRSASHGIVRTAKNRTADERKAIASHASIKGWSERNNKERQEFMKPAHDAWRGSYQTAQSKQQGALARALKGQSDSANEAAVAAEFTKRKIPFTQQTAIGPYNVDFTINNVAVEITSGWARKDVNSRRWRERFEYIINAGWHLYFVWHDTSSIKGPIDVSFTDDLVTWLEFIQRTPSIRCQYRVIWCAREVLAGGCANFDEFAAVFSTYPQIRNRPTD